MLNDEQRAFEQFCAEKCSPGAFTSEWYRTIFHHAYQAGIAWGAADMRERAATECEPGIMDTRGAESEWCAKRIRALPLPGETP